MLLLLRHILPLLPMLLLLLHLLHLLRLVSPLPPPPHPPPTVVRPTIAFFSAAWTALSDSASSAEVASSRMSTAGSLSSARCKETPTTTQNTPST